MIQHQLEQLKELVQEWRKRDYGTGDASYDQGYDTAKESCAKALDELIKEWQMKKSIKTKIQEQFQKYPELETQEHKNLVAKTLSDALNNRKKQKE